MKLKLGASLLILFYQLRLKNWLPLIRFPLLRFCWMQIVRLKIGFKKAKVNVTCELDKTIISRANRSNFLTD